MREWIIGRPECRGVGRADGEVAVGARAMGGFEMRGFGGLGKVRGFLWGFGGVRVTLEGRVRCWRGVGGCLWTIEG